MSSSNNGIANKRQKHQLLVLIIDLYMFHFMSLRILNGDDGTYFIILQSKMCI